MPKFILALIFAIPLFSQSMSGPSIQPWHIVATAASLPTSGCSPGKGVYFVLAATPGQQIYTNSGNGTCIWTPNGGGGGTGNISGSGTPGRIPVFTGTYTVGNATGAQIGSSFSGCASGTPYLNYNGTCSAATISGFTPGAGTLTGPANNLTLTATSGGVLSNNTTGTAANVSGIVAVANGGTGTATPTPVAGTGISITGTWPNQTIAATGAAGSWYYVGTSGSTTCGANNCKTIPASTHNQGTTPFAFCTTAAPSSGHYAGSSAYVPCPFMQDPSGAPGDLIVAWTGTEIAGIVVAGPQGGSGGGSMVYPPAGVPLSTGSAWDVSYTVGTAAGNIVQLDGSGRLPAVSAALVTALPSFAVVNNGVNTGTTAMTLDISASTVANAFKVPVKAGFTATANGAIGYNSTANMLHAAQSGADAFIPQSTASPANGDCVNWVVSGSQYKLGTAGSACGSGGGGTAFSALTTGTNTIMSALIGTGASLGTTGTGTIAATSAATATSAAGLNGTSMASLGTGILKNTTGTGVPSIAIAADFPTLNQTTTGTAAGLTAAYIDWNATSGGAFIQNKPANIIGTTGTMTANALTTWAGGGDIQTPSTQTMLDTVGNLATEGFFATSKGISIGQGTYPGTYAANSFSLWAPAAISASWGWMVPSSDSAGFLVSDGGHTPSHLSTRTLLSTDIPALSYAPVTNGTSGQALTSNGSGGFGTAVTLGGAATHGPSITVNSQTCTLDSNCTITAGVTGSGTVNSLPKFTSGTTIGNSSLTDDGTNMQTTEPLQALNLPWDIRLSGATCNGTNQHTAVLAALNAGHTRLLIPAGCYWQLPTSSWTWSGCPSSTCPANTIPGGLTIDGQDWVLSKIWATGGAENALGPTIIRNINFNGASGTSCSNVTTGCPMQYYMNASSIGTSHPINCYPYQYVSMATDDSPTMVPAISPDYAAMQIGGFGPGDQFFAGANYGGETAYRGSSSSDSAHIFMGERQSNSDALLIFDDCVGIGCPSTSTASSGNVIEYDTEYKQTQAFIQFTHGQQSYATTFSGDGIQMAMANAHGSFTGNFLNFMNAGAVKFKVNSAGAVIGPATAPSGSCSPNGAWVFSQDGHATFCASGTWVTKI